MKTANQCLLEIVVLAILLMASGISSAAMDRVYINTSETNFHILPSIAPGYCTSIGGSTIYEYITNVYYTKNPSNTITLTVNVYIANPNGCKYGESCPSYDPSPEFVNVWIDWNGDKVFDANEKVINDALTGYLNINYRGTMVSSHIISVPQNAVNNTWMRASLGWSYNGTDPCDDPCTPSWTWGNVVDKEISILTPPRIKDINITGPRGNESFPMTTKEVTLKAIITEASGYDIYKISWWGPDVDNVEGPLSTYNPHKYVPARGKHGGNKFVGVTIFYRNTQTGEDGVDVNAKLFDLFFIKYGDDDGDGEPNWFEYWKSDGAVPNMGTARYDAASTAYGHQVGGQIYLTPYSAGQHYVNAIVLNTFFGVESFGGPAVKGIDSAAEIIAHELYHKWVDDQWGAGGIFNGKTDSDRGVQAADANDELPDFYENNTSHTSNNDTDTYDLEHIKDAQYRLYGDQEYMAMRTGNGVRGDGTKDWANPGKQTPGVAISSILTSKIGIAVAGAGFATGKLTGDFSENGNDTDNNGLYESLKLKAALNVTNSGLFRAIAFLIDPAGKNITFINTNFNLSSGIQNITFEFDGVAIREHGVNGPYKVNLTVSDEEGNVLDNSVYNTKNYSYTNFEMSAAGFTGGYTENATDADSDGIYEYLIINVGVNVVKANNYEVEGWLYNSNGKDIGYAKNSRSFGPGNQTIKLNFSGTAIGNGRINGPYVLKYLKLTKGNETQIGFIGEAYNTSAYSYTKFRENTGARFNNIYRDYISDTNLDGTYDYLAIEVGVNVSYPGNYTLTGVLYNKNGVNISMTSVESSLDAGNQTMLLNFNGDEIYNSRANGPYILNYLILQNNNGTQADYAEGVYNTTAYNYTYFASNPLVALSGNYSDSGLDINYDGLYEYLSIGIGVKVASNGNVIASARLMGNNGSEIEWATNTSYLNANKSSMIVLKFDGAKIHNNQMNGPYYLKDLYIYHTGDPEKSIYAANAYTTSAYSYMNFNYVVNTSTTTTLISSTTSTISTSTTTTIPGCKKGDKDCNGTVSDFELLDYIGDWSKSIVGDFDLLEGISNWANG